MTDSVENVAEEIAAEEAVQPHEESQEEVAHEEPQEVDNKDYNFQALRESKKELERKYEQELARMRAEMEAMRPQEKIEEIEIGDEDLVEGKHVKQIYERVERLLQQQRNDTIPDRLKSKFTDFDQVVTPENVEKLKAAEPELYATIVSGQDLYAKGVSAYKALKRFGLVKNEYEPDKKKASSNSAKPLSAQAVKGQGPLASANAFANGLTPELKRQLQKEMAEAIKAR